MTTLLDSNVLIALVAASHTHHDRAEAWLASSGDRYATCPITQGALIRMAVRGGATVADVRAVLEDVTTNPRHVFWSDDVPFSEINLSGVVGHRQVTDAYLAGLARAHQGQLATFDRGLAALHPDVSTLISS